MVDQLHVVWYCSANEGIQMQNPMHYVTVEHVHAVNNNMVVFTIDMSKHRHLQDPDVVQSSMNAYMDLYTSVERWEAHASGRWLYITVTGTISKG